MYKSTYPRLLEHGRHFLTIILHYCLFRPYFNTRRGYGVTVSPRVKLVAVISAGQAGPITIDALAQEKAFDMIRVFERREIARGCWPAIFRSTTQEKNPTLTGLAIAPSLERRQISLHWPPTMPTRRSQSNHSYPVSTARSTSRDSLSLPYNPRSKITLTMFPCNSAKNLYHRSKVSAPSSCMGKTLHSGNELS